MAEDLISEVLEAIEKNGYNTTLEINCANVKNSDEFMSNLTKTIHDQTKYDVGYIADKNLYHLIIGLRV